jgi:predicted ribosomally synthesized peptide with SipW-like signal peptide
MSEKQLYNLSRRRVLAGIGAVGLASAGAGLGTSAYFNDTESFTNNSLTAGEFDLKLDYKSTYAGGPGRLEAVQGMGYPDAEEIEDGVYLLGQAPSPADMQEWEDLVTGEEFDFCAPEADEFLVNGDGIPIFTLDDIKPGDYGEMTVSIHLCDNPGWLEMTGELIADDENSVLEPEADDDPNNSVVDPGAEIVGDGELADSIEVTVWYDEDCDNVYEPTGTGDGQELEVALVSDVSGSMSQEIGDLKAAANSFVDNLASPDEAAAVSFGSGASLDQELTTNYQAVKNAINQYNAGGSTNMTAGVNVAQNELANGTNATAGASKVMIVLSDGVPDNSSTAEAAATAAKDAGTRIFTIALGSGADEDFLEDDIATSPDDAFVAPNAADLDTVYAEIAQVVLAGEQVIVEGSLSEVMTALAEGIDLDGNRSEEDRQPYPGNTTQCIGFEWELPIDVENEVQSDSVEFNVGFNAVQSRHNPSAPVPQ